MTLTLNDMGIDGIPAKRFSVVHPGFVLTVLNYLQIIQSVRSVGEQGLSPRIEWNW